MKRTHQPVRKHGKIHAHGIFSPKGKLLDINMRKLTVDEQRERCAWAFVGESDEHSGNCIHMPADGAQAYYLGYRARPIVITF